MAAYAHAEHWNVEEDKAIVAREDRQLPRIILVLPRDISAADMATLKRLLRLEPAVADPPEWAAFVSDGIGTVGKTTGTVLDAAGEGAASGLIWLSQKFRESTVKLDETVPADFGVQASEDDHDGAANPDWMDSTTHAVEGAGAVLAAARDGAGLAVGAVVGLAGLAGSKLGSALREPLAPVTESRAGRATGTVLGGTLAAASSVVHGAASGVAKAGSGGTDALSAAVEHKAGAQAAKLTRSSTVTIANGVAAYSTVHGVVASPVTVVQTSAVVGGAGAATGAGVVRVDAKNLVSSAEVDKFAKTVVGGSRTRYLVEGVSTALLDEQKVSEKAAGANVGLADGLSAADTCDPAHASTERTSAVVETPKAAATAT